MPDFPCLSPIPADWDSVLNTDDVTTNGKRPAVWRHLPATLVDMALIAGPTMLAIVALNERFPILTTTDGSPRFSVADQNRINEIDQGFNRAIRLGDSIFTLSGSGWWLTMLTLSLATVAVFVAAPALMGRRTLGQRIVGMAASTEATPVAIITPTAGPTSAPSIDLSDSASESNEPAQPAAQDVSEHAEPTPTTALVSVDIRDDPTVELPGPIPGPRATRDLGSDGGSNKPLAPSTIDIDSTERQPLLPISLADESEYDLWDREQARFESESTDAPRSGGSERRSNAASSAAAPSGEMSGEPASSAAGTTLLEEIVSQPTIKPANPPEWSAAWQAWMYWDSASKRWFKHDTETDRWSPVS